MGITSGRGLSAAMINIGNSSLKSCARGEDSVERVCDLFTGTADRSAGQYQFYEIIKGYSVISTTNFFKNPDGNIG
jgi:hypothetical protein